MAKKYQLAQGQTYATLKQVFRAGVVYDEADVKDVLDHTNEEGDAYFTELAEGAAPAGKKTIAVGKAKKAETPKAPEGGEGGEGTGGEGDGKGGETITV